MEITADRMPESEKFAASDQQVRVEGIRSDEPDKQKKPGNF
jgi:hypothetical protein